MQAFQAILSYSDPGEPFALSALPTEQVQELMLRQHQCWLACMCFKLSPETGWLKKAHSLTVLEAANVQDRKSSILRHHLLEEGGRARESRRKGS